MVRRGEFSADGYLGNHRTSKNGKKVHNVDSSYNYNMLR